jgi:hypothetical protein
LAKTGPAFDIQIVRRGMLPKVLKRTYHMSITRRQFLLSTAGAAAGFILPSYYTRALEFLDRHGEPLLESPKIIREELIVCSDRDGELNLGDPWSEPPEMTWREYANQYFGGDLREFEETWEISGPMLDNNVPWDVRVDAFILNDSPNAKAYHLLESLDLGPDLSGPNAVGSLTFTDGACPGVDYLGVSADDDITVSLLQQRLTDLGTGIRLVVD